MYSSNSKVVSVVGESVEGKKWRLRWSRTGARAQESGEKGDREDGLRLEQNHMRSTLVLVLLNPRGTSGFHRGGDKVYITNYLPAGSPSPVPRVSMPSST